MRHNLKLFVLFVLVVLLTACLPNPGAATVAAPTNIGTGNVPPVVASTPAGVGIATATYEPSIAGGDFLAIAVDDLGNGWMRIRTAGNRDNCSWSNQFRFTVTGTIQAQVPHCWELRMTGTGTVKFEVQPDMIGYDTSNILGTGLAFWPSGNNGSYRVTRSGVTTDWIPLTTGPEGVNFPKNSSAITIEFKLENGYMAMPLGEIRNNVLPKY
jgi:hypothetical protein